MTATKKDAAAAQPSDRAQEATSLTEAEAEATTAPEPEGPAYRALVPIRVGGVMAYGPGDDVPAQNVIDHGYDKADGLVEQVGGGKTKRK